MDTFRLTLPGDVPLTAEQESAELVTCPLDVNKHRVVVAIGNATVSKGKKNGQKESAVEGSDGSKQGKGLGKGSRKYADDSDIVKNKREDLFEVKEVIVPPPSTRAAPSRLGSADTSRNRCLPVGL